MDHPLRVGVGDRLAEGLEHLQEAGAGCRPGRGPLAQQPGQGLALDQLHGDERPGVVERADLVDGDDARVLEPAVDAGLGQEPAEQVGRSMNRLRITLTATVRLSSRSWAR